MATYQILYWHDIPVQVRANDAGGRQSKPLSDRFQEAVDLAASAAGLIDGDDYTAAYRWSERQERDGTAAEVAAALAAELEAQYPEIKWRETAKAIKEQA